MQASTVLPADHVGEREAVIGGPATQLVAVDSFTRDEQWDDVTVALQSQSQQVTCAVQSRPR